ncbi:MAG TPA: hypothetical protein VK530_16560 [Candidatus Acidoferrum sp.]|nr:hypothetical protein [Candidatus Acidoferrum sp.]
MNAHVLHQCDEIQSIAAPLALAEAVPDVFGNAHAKLRGVLAFVNGTRTGEAVTGFLELVEQVVLLQNPLHGHSRFHGLEVDK